MVCALQGMGAPEHTLPSIANILLLFTASSPGQAHVGEQGEKRVQARRTRLSRPAGEPPRRRTDLCQGMPLSGPASCMAKAAAIDAFEEQEGGLWVLKLCFVTEHNRVLSSLETLPRQTLEL